MYLTITNEGDVYVSQDEPDSDDLELIDNGDLRVFEMRVGQGFFEATANEIESEKDETEFELGWTQVPQR